MKIETTMNIEKKTFVNPNGEPIEYNDITVEIDGCPIHFTVKKVDQSLFTFLLSRLKK